MNPWWMLLIIPGLLIVGAIIGCAVMVCLVARNWPRFLIGIGIFGLASVATAQWGGGHCAPVGVPMVQAQTPWEQIDEHTLRDPEGNVYDRYDDGVFRLRVEEPNVAIGEAWVMPVLAPDDDDIPPERNFGVDVDKLSPKLVDNCECPIYWIRGKKIAKSEAYGLVGKGTLQDDRKKLSLTLIGSEADRAKVEKDLPAELKDKVKLWSVNPDHWSVAGLGYVTTGTPTIYLQEPSGKVIWRQDTYSGPEDMTTLRKKVDGYDGKKDPGPNAPEGGSSIPPLLWLGGGAAMLLMLARGKKGN